MRHDSSRPQLLPLFHNTPVLLAMLMVTLALTATSACSNAAKDTQVSGSGFQLPPTGNKIDVPTAQPGEDVEEDAAATATDEDVLGEQDVLAEEDTGLDAGDPVDVAVNPADIKLGVDVKGTDAKTDTADVKVAVDVATADISKLKCKDEDGDGYGENCPKGDDCNDTNPKFFLDGCSDCSKGKFAGCPCTGKSKPCYGGEAGTQGIGICAAGVQACVDGFLGQCIGEVNAGVEVCNGVDDDCDGDVDEGVKSTCGTCDLSCVQKSVGQGTENTFSLNSENSSGVGLDPTGAIVIDSAQISLSLKFLWASNSPESTVSKIDCKTVKEVGRYKVCSDPSRTSVDLDGNVWVACRGGGNVAKIMAEKKNCVDKNGNGTIETSQDLNNDGGIQPNEMVAGDECIKFITPVLGSTARAAGVDKDNNVWIGFYSSKTLVHLKAEDGSVMESINLPCSPYGLVIDQKGTIWIQGAGCGLVSVNPATKAIAVIKPTAFSYGAYGINVDGKGRIWLGGSFGGSGAASYDPKNGQWVKCQGVPGSAGIATANDGFVYPAHDCGGGVGKVDGEKCWSTGGAPGSYLGVMSTGGCPHGVAVDFDGFVWGVNWQQGNSVGKADPNNMKAAPVIRKIGNNPYTYSDMTGYTLNYFTAPKGLFTTTFFAGGGGNPISATKAKAVWQSIDMLLDLKPLTKVHLRYRAADTKDLLEAAKWVDLPDFDKLVQLPYDLTQDPANPVIGTMLQIEINLITDDKKVSPAVKSLTAKAKLQ